VSKHRGRKGPEVVRHKKQVDKADRSSLVAALLVLGLLIGLIGWAMLNASTGSGSTTP